MRTLAPPKVAAPPQKVSIRTRFKGLSSWDDAVLRAVGGHLGRLAGADLAERVRLGDGHTSRDWANRKRNLTAASTARWAGAITKSTNELYAAARRSRGREASDKRRAVAAIDRRLAAPVGEGAGRGRGYASEREWFAKLRRRDRLVGRIRRLKRDKGVERVSVVRGGRRLLRTRHYLDAAEITKEQWRERWEASRLFLEASGETGKRWGNESIRVEADGAVSVRLPEPLAHLANTAHKRYVLDGTATFSYRGDEWLARAGADKAVAYRIWYSPYRGRWYVDAAFTPERPPEAPSYEEATRSGAIGVDLNAGHLSVWRLDSSGNPVGRPHDIPLELSGLPASTRDGRLRAAISEVLRMARRAGVRAVCVEDLGFEDARAEGRETLGRGKRGRGFRRTVSGIPTHRFRQRLVGMAARQGVLVVAVDPAYTSRWGREHWKGPLRCSTHQAAGVVIGRRGLGVRARRRVRRPPASHQRMEAGATAPGAGQGAYRRAELRGGGGTGNTPSGTSAAQAQARGVGPVVAGGDGSGFRQSRTVRDGPSQ